MVRFQQDNAPEAVKLLLSQFEAVINDDPLAGQYVVVGQNGTLASTLQEYRDSLIASGFVNARHSKRLFERLGYPGEAFHELGLPFANTREDKVVKYVEESVGQYDEGHLSALSIDRDHEEIGGSLLDLRRDFVYFYNLIERFEDSTIVFDDKMRGEDRVALSECGSNLSTLKLRKEYLLDYLNVRSSSAILGYYRSIQIKESNVAKDYSLKLPFNEAIVRGEINVSKQFSDTLVGTLDMFKLISPASDRHVGPFGLISKRPDIAFLTANGEIRPDEVQGPGKDVNKFLTIAYFKSEVLSKYEGDRRYRIDDNGGVHYGSVWGIFRGIYRLGDDLLFAHIGDVIENLPPDQWAQWKLYNVAPLSTDEHRALRDEEPIPSLVNDLAKEMGIMNEAFGKLTQKFVNRAQELFVRKNGFEELMMKLKRVYSRMADRDTFADRVLTLDKAFTESLNSKALSGIIDVVDSKQKFGQDGKPLGSLRLLRIVTLMSVAYKECERSGLKTKELLKTTREYSIALKENRGLDSAVFERVEREANQLENLFKALFLMHSIRNHGGAHTRGPKALDSDLRSGGFDPTKQDLRSIFREILSRTTSLMRAVERTWMEMES